MFIDGDNYSASGNLSESPTDSEFPTYSALVCWRFLGDSAFHKKLSPQQIPISVDLEDPIIATPDAMVAVRHDVDAGGNGAQPHTHTHTCIHQGGGERRRQTDRQTDRQMEKKCTSWRQVSWTGISQTKHALLEVWSFAFLD